MIHKKILLTILTVASASGCSWIPSVGPDYERPADPQINGWVMDEKGQKLFSTATESRMAWWNNFKDPVLSELIHTGINQNITYDIAKARIEQARANEYAAVAAFLPDVTGNYALTRQVQSARTPLGKFIPKIINQYRLGLDASWEVDIFGGLRRGYEVADALRAAAEAGFDDTGVSVASEIALNYIEYRAFARRVEIAESNAKIQGESKDLVQAKFDAGVVSELDLSQATSQLETTRSLIPSLVSEREACKYQIAVLLGEVPQNFTIKDMPKADVDFEFKDIVDISQPTELLRVRPDVRIAERQLQAQTANIGVAIAEVFPRFNIVGALGVQSIASSSLVEKKSEFWSLSPGVSLPIFSPRAFFADIKLARAEAEEALKNYELTVITALEDAQNSLNGYKNNLDRLASLEKAYTASKRALEISQDLYRQGLVDFQRVIESQRQVFTAEDSLLQSRQDSYLSAIQVYKAFAGGLPEEQKKEEQATS